MRNIFFYIRFYLLLWFSKKFKKEITNPINKKGWKLIFNDEFNCSKLDTTKWTTHEHSVFIKNGVAWLPEQIFFKDGKCYLTTDKYNGPNPIEDLDGISKTIDNKSGMLCSYPALQQKYGYFEIRIKLPPGGIKYWPAFWFGTIESWPPEPDMLELMAPGDSDRLTMTYHWLDDKPNWDKIWQTINKAESLGLLPEILLTVNENIKKMQELQSDYKTYLAERQIYIDEIIKLRIHKQYGKGLSGFNWGEHYHTFAFEWNEKRMTWYIDNVAVFSLGENQWVNFDKRIQLPEYPLYLMINNGACPGYSFKPDEVPMTMPVDYCRVYKK